jgi:hypothetical protein
LKFSYSILAASAMYHMITNYNNNNNNNVNNQNNTLSYGTPIDKINYNTNFAANIVQLSTGYNIYELDACIKWMYPYAEVCKDILTEEKMLEIKNFSSVDSEDSHNIQLYHQNLELLVIIIN